MRKLWLCLLAGCSFNLPSPYYDARGIDDPLLDAPFDARADAASDASPLACPSDYEAVTGAPSRYKRIAAGEFVSRYLVCKNDLIGHTHLVVLNSIAEGNALYARYQEDWWVGAVQRRNQPQTGAGWRNITGGVLAADLWAAGQPNDQNNIESNAENVAVRRSVGLEDVAETDSHPALCECDHVAIDPTVEGDIP